MNKMIIGFTVMTAIVTGTAYIISKSRKEIYDEDEKY